MADENRTQDLDAGLSTGRWQCRSKPLTGALALGAGLATAGTASAGVINIGETLEVGGDTSYSFDLDGDDRNDFRVDVGGPNLATITGLGNISKVKFGVETLGHVFVDNGTNNAKRFTPPGQIDDDSGETVGPSDGPATIYNGDDGNWLNVDDTGYIGLAVTRMFYQPYYPDDFCGFDSNFIDGPGDCFLQTKVQSLDLCIDDGCFDDGYREETVFGWLQVTRGSVILGQALVNNAPGTPARLPGTVPEPATLLLLATGAAGMLGRRRRQKKAH